MDHLKEQRRAVDRFVTQQALSRGGSLPKALVGEIRREARTRADAVRLLHEYYAGKGVFPVKSGRTEADTQGVSRRARREAEKAAGPAESVPV